MTDRNVHQRLAAVLCSSALVLSAAIATVSAKTVVIQRTHIYVYTLPKGCVKTTYSGGVVVWKCGSIYYQPYEGRYVRVYIN
ncbi:hypothetical protein [Mesorhizobium sp. 10J20-29]